MSTPVEDSAKGGAKDCHLGWWSELGVRLGVGNAVRGFFGGSGQRSHAELKRSAPAGRPQGGITQRDVQRWFASLHGTPVAADRSAPILSVIMRQAEVYGYRREGTNPCAGIKRYRRQGRERFLSEPEFRRLGEVLARHEASRPRAVSVIRLLLFTGCRKGEVVSLKWSYYREGKLFLPDSKTGPRTVWLSSAARAILDGLPRRSVWGLPLVADGQFHDRGGSRSGLASAAGGSGPVRCPPSRLAAFLRQHGAGAGREQC